MNEEDLRLIKQIVKESVYEILETEFYDAFFGMLNAFEAGITSFKQQLGAEKGIIAVKEETFTCLQFKTQHGNTIGDFEVASKDSNEDVQWHHAFNILKNSNATINKRYHEEGYQHSYWLFGEKIYRQKLEQKP